MTSITPQDVPIAVDLRGAALVSAAPGLWRVRGSRGRIVGHVRAVRSPDGALRYRAERFDVGRRMFRTVGEFSSCADALQSLRG